MYALDGCEVGAWARPLIGFVSHNDPFLPTEKVGEVVKFNAELALQSSEEECAKATDAVLDELSISAIQGTLMGVDATDPAMRSTLSGGERKRVGVATQAVASPQFLILDEPTGGVDAAGAFRLMRILRRLAERPLPDGRRRAVLVSLQQPSNRVMSLATHVIVMADGLTCYFGPVSGIDEFIAHRGLGKRPPRINRADWMIDILSEEPKLMIYPGSALERRYRCARAAQRLWAESNYHPPTSGATQSELAGQVHEDDQQPWLLHDPPQPDFIQRVQHRRTVGNVGHNDLDIIQPVPIKPLPPRSGFEMPPRFRHAQPPPPATSSSGFALPERARPLTRLNYALLSQQISGQHDEESSSEVLVPVLPRNELNTEDNIGIRDLHIPRRYHEIPPTLPLDSLQTLADQHTYDETSLTSEITFNPPVRDAAVAAPAPAVKVVDYEPYDNGARRVERDTEHTLGSTSSVEAQDEATNPPFFDSYFVGHRVEHMIANDESASPADEDESELPPDSVLALIGPWQQTRGSVGVWSVASLPAPPVIAPARPWTGFAHSYWFQFSKLMQRNFRSFFRNPALITDWLLEFIFIGFVALTFWWGQGDDQRSTRNIFGLLYFIRSSVSLAGVTLGAASIDRERPVAWREEDSGLYPIMIWTTARVVMDCAVLMVVFVIVTVCSYYWITGLRPVGMFVHCGIVYLCTFTSYMLGFALGANFIEISAATGIGISLLIFLNLLGGTFALSIVWWYAWIQYVNYLAFVFWQLMITQFKGQPLSCP